MLVKEGGDYGSSPFGEVKYTAFEILLSDISVTYTFQGILERQGCIMEHKTGYHGNDIRLKRSNSLEECLDLCVSTEGGLFWEFAAGHCWVKSSDSGRRPGTGVSGNRQCGIGNMNVSTKYL